MFYAAFLIWLWRGGDRMSIQPTDPNAAPKPTITGPALVPVITIVEPRTIHDVEADLALAGFELNRHRSRRGDTVNKQERLAQRPALLVQEIDWLLDEWAAMSYATRD